MNLVSNIITMTFSQLSPTERSLLGCDLFSEQTCTRCVYAQDGSIIPEHFCTTLEDECPMEVCCDIETEQECFDDITGEPTSCMRYDEGGCPCPDGEVKCGVNEYSSGYCTSLCCDWTTEQTCYDSYGEPASCKSYDETCP